MVDLAPKVIAEVDLVRKSFPEIEAAARTSAEVARRLEPELEALTAGMIHELAQGYRAPITALEAALQDGSRRHAAETLGGLDGPMRHVAETLGVLDGPMRKALEPIGRQSLDSLAAREMERLGTLEVQRRLLNGLTAEELLTWDANLAALARSARQPWQYFDEFSRDLSLGMKSIVESFESQQRFLEAQGSVYLLSQQYLQTFDWRAVESVSSATALSALEGATTAIARSYDSFIRAVSSLDPQTLPPIVYDLPPLDVAGHADFLRIWFEPERARSSSESEAQSEPQLLIAELRHRVGSQLEPSLGMLNDGLPKMWTGAREALRSSNPDRCRHAAVSTRELVTHLLHLLAPDEGVRQWTSDPDHYDEKRRPTRWARCLYICRGVATEDYASFVRAIVAGTLAKLNLLQKGTHQIEASLEERQIEALWLSVGADLLLFIESANSSRKK